MLGQIAKIDTAKVYEYEICVFKNAKPGRIIKNQTIGIADTTVAYISGRVYEKQDSIPFANISLTNSSGQKFGTQTDINGNYKLCIPKGKYSFLIQYIGHNDFIIKKLKLGTGQMQELIIDIGTGGGFHTYGIFSKKPLTDKELKAKEKKLADN
jgi:hypothetical protein